MPEGEPRKVKVEVLDKADGYTIAAWGAVMLLVWARRSSAQGIDSVHALLQRWAPARPGGVVLVNVVPPQPARPPDDDTRAAMERASRSPIPNVKGVGTIFEGGGFIAASIRAMLARIQLLRTGERLHFFRSNDEAAAWAAHLLAAPEITAQALGEAIQAVRAG